MSALSSVATDTPKQQRYRLPGIEREGIAQLSLLETALWPLQGGKLPANTFQSRYQFTTESGNKTAEVNVRAGLGLQSVDELTLWGLLGATLARPESQPVLLATPYWILRHLGFPTGGFEYAQLRESLLRLAVTSYQNTGFYNPETREREYAAFQFLSILLPTVGGLGESVDNDRCWRIEWNPVFFRFCKATGGNLLFDLDLFRQLSPAARRLFLKLKDRFWRSKKVFFNVDDLTINGLGFSADRPLWKRKFDLLSCLRELLDCGVLELGRGQTDAKELFWKRGKGSYVVVCYEGEYFRRPNSERTISQKNAILDHPLFAPLKKIGVDGPAIRRILTTHSQNLVQRWVQITDVAMHERPRGFAGFRVSPAAFLIDGIQHKRTPPDWMYEFERKQRQEQWKQDRERGTANEAGLRQQYEHERSAALQQYLASEEGRRQYKQTYPIILALHKVNNPNDFHKTAHDATLDRIEKMDFRFPEYEAWSIAQQVELGHSDS